ncbi:TonB-dependent receptor [Flammeovirgaceae bacterium SG7u.111]|nr:TonB-dependent receptor [Flammeovirgaceae bacterium SG7u.132]WPO38350.1 TonB-dependent receptor [Flammeovirgaceae bacterium SG7u.111]
MKIKHLLSILFLLTFIQSNAQISVTGSVSSKKNEVLPGVSVSLTKNGKAEGGITNADGKFNISFQSAGTYNVELRYIGFKSHSLVLEVEENNSYDLGEIKLVEEFRQLQSVEIIGREREDYNSDYSFSASKVAIKNREMPQAISTVTKEFISDRQAFQLADAVTAVSSVTSTGNYNHFNIRGITQAEDGQVINGMRTRQYYFLQPITSHIERVEVIKGPSSVTFSSVDPGGTVNMVTKKPLAEARNEVSITGGSFGTIRGAADFTGPLNEEKTLLYRLNAAFQEARSFRDLVQNNALLISPSISYLPNSSTALNAELIYSSGVGNLDRGQPIFGRINGEFDLNSTPTSMNVGASNDYYKSKELTMMANFSKSFGEKIEFNASYMKQTWTEDLVEHRTENRAAVDIDGNAIPTLAAMRYVEREQYWDTDNFNAFFNVGLGGDRIKNTVLVGYDGSRWERTIGGGQNSARRYLKNDGTAASYNPENAADFQMMEVDGVTMPVPNVPHFDLVNQFNGIRETKDYVIGEFGIPANLTTTHGVYIQNQFKLGKFSALLNLRYEWFSDIFDYKNDEEEFKNEAFIPRIGLTYELSKSLSAYATYLEGFQPQTNTVSLSPATEGFFWSASPGDFDPLLSDLKELGLKGEFFNGKVQGNLALFEITQKNVLIGDTYDLENLTARGEQRSRGFEWDVSGYILQNLQVVASYAYTDAVIVEDEEVALIGERIGGAPKHSANFWGRYDLLTGTLRGLGIGLGMQYRGDKYSWYSYSSNDRLLLPAYTVFDGALYYKPVNSDIQLILKVNNITDKTYWSGALNQFRLAPGAPRNLLMTITYKF